jgi:hypothetical protein
MCVYAAEKSKKDEGKEKQKSHMKEDLKKKEKGSCVNVFLTMTAALPTTVSQPE